MTATKDEPKTSNGTSIDSAWVCINIEPFPCPCGEATIEFVSVQHLIIVWPSVKDKYFKSAFREAHADGKAPEIRIYEEEMGDCISYYEVEAKQLRGHRRRRS